MRRALAPVSFLPGGTITLGGRECPGRGGPAGSDQEELTQVDLSRAGAGASRALGEGSRTGDPRWGTGERMASGDRGKTSKSPPDCPGSGGPALHGLSPASKGPREGRQAVRVGRGHGVCAGALGWDLPPLPRGICPSALGPRRGVVPLAGLPPAAVGQRWGREALGISTVFGDHCCIYRA